MTRSRDIQGTRQQLHANAFGTQPRERRRLSPRREEAQEPFVRGEQRGVERLGRADGLESAAGLVYEGRGAATLPDSSAIMLP